MPDILHASVEFDLEGFLEETTGREIRRIVGDTYESVLSNTSTSGPDVWNIAVNVEDISSQFANARKRVQQDLERAAENRIVASKRTLEALFSSSGSNDYIFSTGVRIPALSLKWLNDPRKKQAVFGVALADRMRVLITGTRPETRSTPGHVKVIWRVEEGSSTGANALYYFVHGSSSQPERPLQKHLDIYLRDITVKSVIRSLSKQFSGLEALVASVRSIV